MNELRRYELVTRHGESSGYTCEAYGIKEATALLLPESHERVEEIGFH